MTLAMLGMIGSLVLKGTQPGDMQIQVSAQDVATNDIAFCSYNLPWPSPGPWAFAIERSTKPDRGGNYRVELPFRKNLAYDPADICKTEFTGDLTIVARDPSADPSSDPLLQLYLSPYADLDLADLKEVSCGRGTNGVCVINSSINASYRYIGFKIPGFDPGQKFEGQIDFRWSE